MSPNPDLVTVSVIGTGGVSPAASGTIAETPAGQSNLRLNVVQPAAALGVRFAHVFLVSFVGLLTAAGIGVAAVDPTTAAAVTLGTAVKGAALSSLVVACVETLKNLITIFGKLENDNPLLTGSI